MQDKGKIKPEKLHQVLKAAAPLLSGNDLDFYWRVWKENLNIYIERLKAIEFAGMRRVLDAGCGFGQWTLSLAELNDYVCGIDIIPDRIKVVKTIVQKLEIKNIELKRQSVEHIKYSSRTFDGIFCYGVLYMTDYKKTLKEFRRLLKPGGKIYLCLNGLGWYIYNILDNPNKSMHYNPRELAIKAVANTLNFFSGGRHNSHQELIIPSQALKNYMSSIGFYKIKIGAEGTIKLRQGANIHSFYASRYYGLEGVYEIIAYKK